MKKIGLFLSVMLSLCFCFTMVACDSFNKNTTNNKTEYEITVIDGTGSGKYKKDDIVTISATVPEKSEFESWTVDDKVVSTANPYSFTCSSDLTIKANFKAIQEAMLTVEGGEGSGLYLVGDTVSITATSQANKEFVCWKINGEIVSTSKDYSFVISGDTTIVAEFRSDFYQYISTVKKLNSEDFVILNLTDIQLHNGNSTDVAFEVIDQLVAKTNPNMIVFLGDLLNDNDTYGSKNTANAVLDKIDSIGVPWAFIFGNHDYEDYQTPYESKKDYPSSEMIEKFATYENCLFKKGPDNVSGNSNYVVNIVDEDDNIVKSLIMLDSRLAGLDNSNTAFYNRAVEEVKEMNNGEGVENIVYTHIAIPAYGDAYLQSQETEFSTVVGSLNRKATDLATGTTSLFDSILEKGLTKNVICGHDHENAYYINYQGVNLIFSMKSSDGDHYDNVAEIGGSYFTIGENVEIDYVKANIPFEVKKEKMSNQPFALDTLADWQYSGAYLTFDIEYLGDGEGYAKYSLMGTNIKRDISENEKYGSWNRLTSYVTIDFATKTASIGELTLIENNKYSYRANLVDYILNTGSELADGSETLRLLFFNEFTENFAISNIKYEFTEEVAGDKIDLSSAEITINSTELYYTGSEVVPDITVKLGDNTLLAKYDYKLVLTNNIEVGTAKLKIVPSGLGINTWTGEKSIDFEIIADPYAGYRGQAFTAGVGKEIDIEDGAYDYVEFDYLITNGADKQINVKIYGYNWEKYYGSIWLDSTCSIDAVNGVTVTNCTDEYSHVKFDLGLINRTNASWNRDNVPSGVGFIYLENNATANGYIDNITFGEYTKYTVTVTGGTGSGKYIEGTEATVVATPENGYDFVKWTVDGDEVSTSASYTFTVTEDITLVAEVKKGYRGQAFTAGVGKEIDIEDGAYDYVEFDYLITNGADKQINVKIYGYNWEKYYGSIWLDSTCSIDAVNGVTVTNCTDEYSHVKFDLGLINRTNASWNRDNVPSGVGFIYLENNATANGYIDNITFGEYTKYTVTVTGGTGSGKYIEGTEVTVVATAQTGKTFVKWTVDGDEVSTSASYTFTVTEDITIVAVFESEAVSLTKNGYIDIKSLVPTNVSTVSFEYKFGNTDKVLNIRLADESGYGDNNYYGMYRIFDGTASSQYTGSKTGNFAADATSACTVTSLSDGWYKITFNVASMNKTGTVNKIGYIFADKFSDGTASIRNIVCA